MSSIYDLDVTKISGEVHSLADFRGKLLLIVNTASECGFTPQYAGLEKLYQNFSAQGLEILGFPCNQFGKQEPGADIQIQNFCSERFAVSFPLYSKVKVNGPEAHPLFQHLKRAAPGIMSTELIKWNFTKFLVGRDGELIDRYAPTTTPEQLEARISALL